MAESSTSPRVRADPAAALIGVLQKAGIEYIITTGHEPESPDDTILLQAADGGKFPISRALLFLHSSFFADLPAFLEAEDPSGETLVFPLPNATSAGLGLLVRLLPYVPTAKRDEPHHLQLERLHKAPTLAKVGWDDLPTVYEAVSIARTYEMDDVVRAFPFSPWRPDQPLLDWAILALTRTDEELTDRSDVDAIRALRSSEVLQPAAEELLDRCAPKALERYLGMRTGWAEVTILLRAELEGYEPIRDGREDYIRKCEGIMGFRRCAAREAYPRWKDLRTRAAEKVYEFAISNGDPPPDLSLVAIKQAVPCPICAQRLDDTFARPLNDFWNASAPFAIG